VDFDRRVSSGEGPSLKRPPQRAPALSLAGVDTVLGSRR
jgi:hypothetical protein